MTPEKLEILQQDLRSRRDALRKAERAVELAELTLESEIIQQLKGDGLHPVDIYTAIRLLRIEAEYTQEQLARKAGYTSTATISHLENGSRSNLHTMQTVCNALGYDLLFCVRPKADSN